MVILVSIPSRLDSAADWPAWIREVEDTVTTYMLTGYVYISGDKTDLKKRPPRLTIPAINALDRDSKLRFF
jgi:hypothetical protein